MYKICKKMTKLKRVERKILLGFWSNVCQKNEKNCRRSPLPFEGFIHPIFWYFDKKKYSSLWVNELSRYYVSRVVEYHKKSLQHLTTFFISTWWRDFKNIQEIEISQWLFELVTCMIGQPIQPICKFFALSWSALKKPLL